MGRSLHGSVNVRFGASVPLSVWLRVGVRQQLSHSFFEEFDLGGIFLFRYFPAEGTEYGNANHQKPLDLTFDALTSAGVVSCEVRLGLRLESLAHLACPWQRGSRRKGQPVAGRCRGWFARCVPAGSKEASNAFQVPSGLFGSVETCGKVPPRVC